jgi:hypothetical protein
MLSETTQVYVVLELKPICKVGYDLAHQKRKVERGKMPIVYQFFIGFLTT